MPDSSGFYRASLGARVLAGFSTRIGGVSEAPYEFLNLALNVGDDPELVRANRSVLLASLGVAAAGALWAEQVHGSEVAVVTAAVAAGAVEGGSSQRGIEGVDALVTSVRGVLLCIRVADCLPVLFADAAAGVVGAAHAGRRGLVAGVLANTVAAMESLGAARADISAAVGPGICGGCYEVSAELAAEVEAAIPGTRAQTRAGTPSLDLPGAAGRLLAELGLRDVKTVDECTAEHPDRWYSYRRSARTGRFAGFVALS